MRWWACWGRERSDVKEIGKEEEVMSEGLGQRGGDGQDQGKDRAG